MAASGAVGSTGASGVLLPYVYYPIYPVPNYSYTPINAYPWYVAPSSPGETQEGFELPRVSSFDERAKAEKLVARGDSSFARRQYAGAIARYQEAVQAAPDVADSRIRLVLALIAERRYPAAARAFFEALDAQKDWSESELNLEGHYSPGQLAKTKRLLTRLVDADPMNAELALALGIQLFFTGQRDKAELYFNRAVQLGADEKNRLAGFLRQTQVAQAP